MNKADKTINYLKEKTITELNDIIFQQGINQIFKNKVNAIKFIKNNNFFNKDLINNMMIETTTNDMITEEQTNEMIAETTTSIKTPDNSTNSLLTEGFKPINVNVEFWNFENNPIFRGYYIKDTILKDKNGNTVLNSDNSNLRVFLVSDINGFEYYISAVYYISTAFDMIPDKQAPFEIYIHYKGKKQIGKKQVALFDVMTK